MKVGKMLVLKKETILHLGALVLARGDRCSISTENVRAGCSCGQGECRD